MTAQLFTHERILSHPQAHIFECLACRRYATSIALLNTVECGEVPPPDEREVTSVNAD